MWVAAAVNANLTTCVWRTHPHCGSTTTVPLGQIAHLTPPRYQPPLRGRVRTDAHQFAEVLDLPVPVDGLRVVGHSLLWVPSTCSLHRLLDCHIGHHTFVRAVTPDFDRALGQELALRSPIGYPIVDDSLLLCGVRCGLCEPAFRVQLPRGWQSLEEGVAVFPVRVIVLVNV